MQFKGIKKLQPKQQTQSDKKPFLSHGIKRKLKRLGVVTMIVIFIGLLSLIFYLISNFFDKYAFRFQTPIIIQTPVLMYDREGSIKEEVNQKVKALLPTPTETPTPTPKPEYKYLNFNLVPKAYAEGIFSRTPTHRGEAQIIDSQKHAAIIWRIYELESTFGRQDDCMDQGLVNGFGFGINTSEHRCYASFATVVADVNNWIDEHYQAGWDISTILCYYNQGLKVTDCGYAQKFLSII